MIAVFIFLLSIISLNLIKLYPSSHDSKLYIIHNVFGINKYNEDIVYLLFHSFVLLGVFTSIQNTIFVIHFMILSSVLISLSYIDLKCLRLPNDIVLPVIVYHIGFSILNMIFYDYYISFKDMFFGGIVSFIILLVLAVIRLGGLGGGDIKLGLLIGLIIGSSNIVLLLCYSFLLAGIVALLLIKMKYVSNKDFIPLGVFFAFCTIFYIMNYIIT